MKVIIMKKVDNIIIEQSMSEFPINRQLKGNEYAQLRPLWRIHSYPIDYFIDRIKEGHYWTHVYGNKNKVSLQYFISTQCIVISMSKCETDMNTFISNLMKESKPLPTFAYTTWDDNQNGLYYYKLVYCFSTRILGYEFNMVYDCLTDKLGLIQKSNQKANNAKVATHCGNPTDSFRCYRTNYLYDISDFV